MLRWGRYYRCEGERVDLNTEGCDVFLLEFSCQVTLHEGGLSNVLVNFLEYFA